ncbi:MAG: hypothetical protein P8183_22335 [Anaerolineae bacterium]
MNIQKITIVLLHAFIGWALCAATMGIGMATMTLQNALIVHAVGAPIFFTIISLIYSRKTTTSGSGAVKRFHRCKRYICAS